MKQIKGKKPLILLCVLVIIVAVYIKSCSYVPINGTVVDVETKLPIEGAVVLAEWTVGKGLPGLSYTDIYKVVETMTDKNGRFTVDAYVFRPFINKPQLTIYKAGYVCWNNEFIFPGFKHRTDFIWERNRIYAMERFSPKYSLLDHVSFIRHFVTSSTQLFEKAYRWEEIMEQRELSGTR